MKPDAIINVRFLTTAEGGRNTAVEGQFYACPLFVDNEGFDCRLLLEGRRLELGSAYEVPIKFLYREQAPGLSTEALTSPAPCQSPTMASPKPSGVRT